MKCRITFAAFTLDVLALYGAPMRRKATRAKMQQVLEEFGRLCRRPSDLTPSAIAAWIAAHPGRRPSTVAALLTSLRAACRYGAKWGYLERNPFEFRAPREWVDWDAEELPPPVHAPAAMARVLSLADLEALGGPWQAARLRALVYTASYTGARKRELLGLPVADVDLEAGLIRITTNARRGLKTRASRACLPIPGPLAAVLSEWLPICGSAWVFPGARRSAPWLEGSAGGKALDQLKALGIRAGVPGMTFQSCRHTFASLAETWGFSELALQRQLRHSSPFTQRGYRHELPELLRAAGERVSYRAGG
jgi:integrase